jgi:integrase
MFREKARALFDSNYRKMPGSFRNTRKKVASNLQNPRINSITLRTFRHFGATMLCHQTRDILLVKKLLGHKKIENTLKYTQLIQFKDDEYETAIATTVDEARTLGAAGFSFFTTIQGIQIFRKPKRFVG